MTNIFLQLSMEINAPKSNVWDALVNPEKVKQYLFGTNLICDWKVGSPILFKGEWHGKAYEDKGILLRFEPMLILQYSYWSSFSGLPDAAEHYQIVTYQLREEKGKVILSVKQENCASEETKAHSEKNWTMVLGTIKELVEKE
jgi:uncharacterized protein YndB with AHSA1/START domain